MSQYSSLNALFASNFLMIWFLLGWSLFWKGLALWKSARRGKNWWFIILLIVNTLGLLEILYLFVFSRDERKTIPKDKQIMEVKAEEKG
jgi:phosphoglycerol transferase MdoB-like AlkP superfamily enzyme